MGGLQAFIGVIAAGLEIELKAERKNVHNKLLKNSIMQVDSKRKL